MSVKIAAFLNRFIDHSITNHTAQGLRFLLVMITVVTVPQVHTLSGITRIEPVEL